MCRYSYLLFFLLTSSGGAYGFTSTNSPKQNLQRTNGFTSKTVTQKPPSRTHDFALNVILESGIDPLTSTAIFAAAAFLLFGQTEIVTTEDIKMGKERLKDLANAEKNTEIDKSLEKMDLIDDSVKSAMEEMINSFQKSPIQSRSRPTAISFDTPEISSLKRRVASTLKSEMAMKERLGNEHEDMIQEILMQQPGPQKPILKPKVVEPNLAEEEKVKKSPVVVRIVKKMVMPWKKFSTLS